MTDKQSLAGFLLFCTIIGIVTFFIGSIFIIYKFVKLCIDYQEHRRLNTLNYGLGNTAFTSAVAIRQQENNITSHQPYSVINV